MILLVDIGNSNIKFALYYKKKLFVILNLFIIKKNFKNKILFNLNNFFNKINKSINNINFVFLCSVNSYYEKIIYNIFLNLNIKIYNLKNNLKINKLIIDIDNPSELGADLIATAYGAINKYNNEKNILIIDMGTSTTISIIKNNFFLGTIIMPGLEIISNILFKKIRILKKFNFYLENKNFGKNTKESINIGIVNSHLFSINSFIDNIIYSEKFLKVKILFTGGLFFKIKNFFLKKIDNNNYIFVPNLLFEGMYYILKENFLII